jgi:hypothetical protein
VTRAWETLMKARPSTSWRARALEIVGTAPPGGGGARGAAREAREKVLRKRPTHDLYVLRRDLIALASAITDEIESRHEGS